MIDGQHHRHHQARHHLVSAIGFLYDDRFEAGGAHAEYGGLRVIDNRCKMAPTARSADVGDGKCSALKLL